MKIRLFTLVFFSFIALCVNDSFAQNCPSSGTVRNTDGSGTTIELSVTPFSSDIELNIFDSNNRVYIYSESKLDPGFYIQENVRVSRSGNKFIITGLEDPFSESRYQIVVLSKNCKPVELAIRD